MQPVNQQPTPQPTPSNPPADNFSADLVSNIPVHQAGGVPAQTVGEDAESDKIMRDVGHELKKDDLKKPKKHHLPWNHQSKKDPNFSARPIAMNQPQMPAPAHNQAPAPVQTPAPATPQAQNNNRIKPQAQLQPKAAAPKPEKSRSMPVLAISMTIFVTGILIAAAIYAYK